MDQGVVSVYSEKKKKMTTYVNEKDILFWVTPGNLASLCASEIKV